MAKDDPPETAQEKAARLLAELLEKAGTTQQDAEDNDSGTWHGR